MPRGSIFDRILDRDKTESMSRDMAKGAEREVTRAHEVLRSVAESLTVESRHYSPPPSASASTTSKSQSKPSAQDASNPEDTTSVQLSIVQQLTSQTANLLAETVIDGMEAFHRGQKDLSMKLGNQGEIPDTHERRSDALSVGRGVEAAVATATGVLAAVRAAIVGATAVLTAGLEGRVESPDGKLFSEHGREGAESTLSTLFKITGIAHEGATMALRHDAKLRGWEALGESMKRTSATEDLPPEQPQDPPPVELQQLETDTVTPPDLPES